MVEVLVVAGRCTAMMARLSREERTFELNMSKCLMFDVVLFVLVLFLCKFFYPV